MNPTRSGWISRAWIAGTDVLLEIEGYFSPRQTGLFRIPLADLEQATKGRPNPAPVNPDAALRGIRGRLEKIVGDPRDFVPAPDLLAKIAEAFAAAAREFAGCDLDFSASSLDRFRSLVWSLGEARD